MRPNNLNFLLAELICKSIAGTLTDEENAILTNWKEQKDNKELFDKIVDADRIDNKFEIYNQFNSQRSLNRVKSKVEERRKERTRNRFVAYFKYAAAFVLLSGFGYLLYTLQAGGGKTIVGAEQQYAKSDQVVNVEGTIRSGNKKTVLILADGKEIDLAQTDQVLKGLPGVSVNNTEKLLSYEDVTEHAGNSNKEVEYNTLRVPIGGEYQVELPDGTRVWLNSASSLKYPIRFVGSQRVVELQGEAYFEVTKDTKQFVVITGDVQVKVLGTKFNLSAYEDDATVATTLVEGKVSMSGTGASKDAILIPNKQAVYHRQSKALNIRSVNVEEFIAWKDGRFHFQKQELGSILTRLSRWYGINVVYADQSLKTKVFTGMAEKDKPVEHILQLISKTADINYTIENNKVILKEKD
ncbi:FecR family protein [Pontibacter pudoricolor]|uniref:FecR family protein n=1 Tax=Pontibacter pudoricolor TaxID=2694930 RepID=UPI001391C338|nr:FecR domain-containing protein [Pontibacter pudoricolor]